MEFLNLFNEVQVLLLIFVVIYGLMFGLGNTYVRVICSLSTKTMNQSQLGKFMDMLFYIVISYLTYIYMGVSG